jgi:hypothetical protein
MNVDLAPFLAAIIEESGGEVFIPYEVLTAQTGEKSLTIDFVEEGQLLRLGLIDVKDIPEDVE